MNPFCLRCGKYAGELCYCGCKSKGDPSVVTLARDDCGGKPRDSHYSAFVMKGLPSLVPTYRPCPITINSLSVIFLQGYL